MLAVIFMGFGAAQTFATDCTVKDSKAMYEAFKNGKTYDGFRFVELARMPVGTEGNVLKSSSELEKYPIGSHKISLNMPADTAKGHCFFRYTPANTIPWASPGFSKQWNSCPKNRVCFKAERE